jgi:SAM-dependent methyltransferase
MSWDEAAATFDNEPDHGLRDPAVKAAWSAVLLPRLPSQRCRIADLGCGTGSVSALFAEAGHEVHGVDQSPRMLEIARAKCGGDTRPDARGGELRANASGGEPRVDAGGGELRVDGRGEELQANAPGRDPWAVVRGGEPSADGAGQPNADACGGESPADTRGRDPQSNARGRDPRAEAGGGESRVGVRDGELRSDARYGDPLPGRAVFFLGDAADPPLEPHQYDVVFARHVLWTLPEEAVGRWVELLRPGGRLVLVEGRWSTGAGLTAEECRGLVLRHRRQAVVTPLPDPALWGGPIDDERYLLVSDV